MASTEIKSPSNPIRPSRQPKESTALLMSVIRSISSSESNEHRDKEKAKLEKEFKRSDQKLDELIACHHEELGSVIQAFGKASSRLNASREKIKVIKENLTNCKMLLNCKRDELKRLWLEGIEHKQALFLLEQIEGLKGVPEKVDKYLQKKHYLHATELLMSSVNAMEGDLESVEALKEVRNELLLKKQALQSKIVEELHRHLYVRSTSDIAGLRVGRDGVVTSPFYRQGSDRAVDGGNTRRPDALTPIGATRQQNMGEVGTLTPTHKYRLNYRSTSGPTSPEVYSSSGQVTEDLLLSDPEEDSAHFIAILVECLALLNKIPDAVEAIKSRMRRELVHIVRRTSQLCADNTQMWSPEVTSQFYSQSRLYDFLQLIFEQFRCVAQSHECVLQNLRRLANMPENQGEIQLYDMAEFWSRVQVVLQVLLSDYLDVENTTCTSLRPTATFVETTAEVATYFSKKRPAKPKRFTLFKFDASSHAISMNSYLKEQQTAFDSNEMLNSAGKGGEIGEKNYVCKPNARNILAIFIPLMKFIEEIETALGCREGPHCALHDFITDFIRGVFVGQIHAEAVNTIELATKSNDAWRANTDLETQKSLNISRPLLQSTFRVERKVQELRDIMQDLPHHAEPFLEMICNILASYKESCLAAYRGIVQPESEDKRIISATWAKDEDINRLLRSLPNWTNLQKSGTANAAVGDIEESPEEVRLRNKKESEMLTRNLAEATIPPHEILSDVSQLRTLALLQESLEWFSGRIREIAGSLPVHGNTSKITSPSSPSSENLKVPIVPEQCVRFHSSLNQLAREFEDMAEMCLLVLHIEVRVHCFYHLLPVAKQSSFASGVDTQDPDPEVVKLNKDFSNIDEALSTSLQPRKFKYVVEGLGHLVSAILINSAQYIKRINENGVKKMCRNIFAIQQNLTNITLSREVALDHARHFFELLYYTPEEILNQIVEHGPKFTELDYLSAMNLLHRSRPGTDPQELDAQIKRLHDILNEVIVKI